MSQNLERGGDAALQSPRHYPPSPSVSESNNGQDQEVIDGSEAIFNMYLEMSLRKDKEVVETWNQDAKSILLFSGLFSATVAAALGPSMPAPVNSQDTSAFILARIAEFAVDLQFIRASMSNGSHPNDPIRFGSPGVTFVERLEPFDLVNSLWFLSLIISLTCALLAILSQQWARGYLVAVRQRDAPYNQARIREFLAEGIHDSGIALLVDAMWASHQLSFVLFTLGLVAYFSESQNSVTFYILLIWSMCWVCLYLWVSITGIFRKNSPYYTPLSSLIYRLSQLTPVPMAPPRPWYRHSRAASSNRVEGALRLRKMAGESAQRLLQCLDGRILEWTFKSLNQDHEFERFFAGIPDFCDSRAVTDPDGLLRKLNNDGKLSRALIGLMYRTMTSHLISEPTRRQRIRICTRAIDALPTLVSWSTLRRVIGEWGGLRESTDPGDAILHMGGDRNSDPRTLVSWSTLRRVFGEWGGLRESVDSVDAILHMGGNRNSDPRTAFCARCIVAVVIARGQVYGDRWSGLTSQFLTSDMEVWDGISRTTLRGYLGHGYSALLANLIFITRVILRFSSKRSQNVLSDVSSRTLREVLSNIDVRLASPEMRREYCRLWNDLVQMAQDDTSSPTPTIATEILRHLRKSYVALHESTETSLFYTSPDDDDLLLLLGSSYPLCSIHNHHTSPQTQPPTTVNRTSSPPPRLSLSALQNTIPQNVVMGATEDANEVSFPAEATPGLVVPPSPPPPLRPPLGTQLSVEIPPTVQEGHGQNETSHFIAVDSPQLSTSDASVAQSDRISSNLESPSLTPDTGPSATVPNTNVTSL